MTPRGHPVRGRGDAVGEPAVLGVFDARGLLVPMIDLRRRDDGALVHLLDPDRVAVAVMGESRRIA